MANLERYLNRKTAGLILATSLTVGACSADVKPTLAPTSMPSSSPELVIATPTPSEAAGTPEANIQNFTVEKLGTFAVLPGDVISGDVAMSNTADSAIFPLYDQDTHKAADVKDNTKTALFVVAQVPGVIHAEWGATVTRGLTADKQAEMLKLQTLAKTRAGFEKVDVVLWTGYDTTVDEAGYKTDGTQGGIAANPTESPAATANGSNLENLSNQDRLKVILTLFAEGKVDPNSAQGQALMDIVTNCLCGCSEPEATPSPKPSPKPTTETQCTPLTDIYLKSGQKVTVKGPFNVLGDVTMDGVSRHDSSSKTFAVDKVTDTKQHTIIAPWGADVQKFNICANPQDQITAYNKAIVEGKNSGRTFDSKSIVEK